MNCKVWFDDGSTKIFSGFWKKILKDIDKYCEKNNLNTISATWI